jgi:hypothetical protein
MIRDEGFSVFELVVALAIAAGVTAALFGTVRSSRTAFAVQPEASDLQQRTRVAADALMRDLLMAGAGAASGATAGALVRYFAPVLPFRLGAVADDPAGTFRTDTLTLVYAASASIQTTTTADTTSASGTVPVASGPGCPLGSEACGFSAGDTLIMYDAAGHFDTFTVRSVSGGDVAVAVNKPAGFAPTFYPVGSKVASVIQRTYFLKTDVARGLHQLAMNEGGTNGDVPLVDHIVGLQFHYYGDPEPPRLLGATPCVPGALRRCTTYGPAPPESVAPPPTAYPAGENCVFARDAETGLAIPRLGVLGGSAAAPLVPLDESRLTDGPWCPDDTSANRYDADLLRVRTISISLRAECASDALRGPAGMLFSRGGTAVNPARFVPDQEITLQVSPRNLRVDQ